MGAGAAGGEDRLQDLLRQEEQAQGVCGCAE
jgi:hypothetical protein